MNTSRTNTSSMSRAEEGRSGKVEGKRGLGLTWVLYVLQELVAVNNIEGVVGEGQVIGVDGLKRNVREVPRGSVVAGLLQDGFDSVAGDDTPLRYERGQIRGDGAGTAAYVEDFVVWLDVWEKESGRVLSGAARVVAYHGGVVAMGVGGLLFSRCPF